MAVGTEYEVLTQELFQDILNQSSIKTIDVQHDVVLEGKTASHQIDVHWRFEIGGIEYETVIQAKNWSRSVSQGELLKFKAVLDDLPGQPRGVFVTRTGYQSGAESFARANGILLFQLEEIGPKEQPSKIESTALGHAIVGFFPITIKTFGSGAVGKTYQMVIYVFEPEFTDIEFQLDPADHHRVVELGTYTARPDQMELFDQNGIKTGDLQKIWRTVLSELPRGAISAQEVQHNFEAPTYMQWHSKAEEFIRVHSVTAKVRVRLARKYEKLTFHLPDVSQFLLRNLTSKAGFIIAKRHDGRSDRILIENPRIENHVGLDVSPTEKPKLSDS